MRLAAGLRPDPLGELKQLGVPTCKAGREGKGKREGRDGKRAGRKGQWRRGMEGEGRLASHTIFRPWTRDNWKSAQTQPGLGLP